MPEELKELLEGLAKAAAAGKVGINKVDPKDLPSGLIDALMNHARDIRRAELSQALGDSMKDAVIAAARDFVKAQNLPEEKVIDYIIYGTIANTLRFIEDDDDDDEDDCDDDNCECDCPHCNPNPAPTNNGGAEADPTAEVVAAIDALKELISKRA